MVTITRDALLRQLRDKARKYNAIVAQESNLGAEKKPLRDAIVSVLNHLGTDKISVGGLKVTVSTERYETIDRELAAQLLSPEILARITILKQVEKLRVIPERK